MYLNSVVIVKISALKLTSETISLHNTNYSFLLLHYINTDPAQTTYTKATQWQRYIDFPDPNEKKTVYLYFLGFKDSMFKSKDFKQGKTLIEMYSPQNSCLGKSFFR
jgi:hypothetical protein